ncbi:hypothetical protein E4U19_000247, partial [Claviceps sp. Clav32 group G5]
PLTLGLPEVTTVPEKGLAWPLTLEAGDPFIFHRLLRMTFCHVLQTLRECQDAF